MCCDTEQRGHATPQSLSRERLVVDASKGFIPLWAENTTLRWRFRESSFQSFQNPEAAKAAAEQLLAEAILAWEDAAPVKFTKKDDVWDFEIVMRRGDDCDINGCVLASAFFPDAGRHQLTLYPRFSLKIEKSRSRHSSTRLVTRSDFGISSPRSARLHGPGQRDCMAGRDSERIKNSLS